MENPSYAYLGPPGTFSELAIAKYSQQYGGETIPCDSIREIVGAIMEERVDLGLLPLENSLEGSVNLSLDLLFQEEELQLYRELVLPIEHFLLAPDRIELESIEEIYSHPQAIAQSGDYLNKYLPRARIVYTESTAAAAGKIKDQKNKVVIGSSRLAEIYNLEILDQNLEGELPNSTRFVLAGRRGLNMLEDINHSLPQTTEFYRTSIICTPRVNQPGVLHKILGEFARREIDLTRIESRPTRKRLGEYIFYIDLKGHREQSQLQQALTGVKEKSGYYRWLGSYPRIQLRERSR
ncbi:MAG: prephenate dehydratase [Bacillota bacterium]